MRSAELILRCGTFRTTLGASFALFLFCGCARSADQGGRDAQVPVQQAPAASVTTPPPPSTSSVVPSKPMTNAEADLSLHDMSFFHGDGERLAFSRDGRVLYEHLSRRDGLRRWTKSLDGAARQELLAIADRFAASKPEVPSRTGIPDEVNVSITYRDGSGAFTTIGIWEADFGKLPAGHVAREFRTLVKRIGDSMRAAGPGTPRTQDSGPTTWPHVLDAVH